VPDLTEPTPGPVTTAPVTSTTGTGGSASKSTSTTTTTTTTTTPSSTKAPEVVALEVTFGDSDSSTVLGGSSPVAAAAAEKAGATSKVVATAVASNASHPGSGDELYASALAGTLDPLNTEDVWSTFGAAAGRFGPWMALLGIAFVIEAVARSAVKDRLRVKDAKRA
jgi:hypothetical protein